MSPSPNLFMDQGKHIRLDSKSFRYNLWVKKNWSNLGIIEITHPHTHVLQNPEIFKYYQVSGLCSLSLSATRAAFLLLSVSHLVFHIIFNLMKCSASQRNFKKSVWCYHEPLKLICHIHSTQKCKVKKRHVRGSKENRRWIVCILLDFFEI